MSDHELFENREEIMPKVLERKIVESQKPQSMSLAVWFGIVFGVAASVFVGWGVIAPILKKTEQTEVPLIRKTSSPVKVRPSDPGGMDIPNRDKRVYARIDAGNDEPVVERLLPPPEQPIAPEVELDSEMEAEPLLEPKAVLVEETKDSLTKAAPVVSQEPKTKEIKQEPIQEEITRQPEIKLPEIKIVEAKQPVAAIAPPPPHVVSAPSLKAAGIWKVQLLSAKDREAVVKEWEKISLKHSELIAGLPYFIEEADLGDKGVFYRLKIGDYNERAEAEKLCEQLKPKKLGCFVVK